MTDDEPFALLITWTCYGTWLPGDARGHVSNTLLPDGGFRPKVRRPGSPYAPGDPYTRERAGSLQRFSTVLLTVEQATLVAHVLVAAARQRGWRILRGALMPNHVHLVLADCPDDGPAVRRILKGNSQAALSRQAGVNRRWWTAGGSDRYKHDWAAIENAVRYVARQKGKLVEIVEMCVVPCEG